MCVSQSKSHTVSNDFENINKTHIHTHAIVKHSKTRRKTDELFARAVKRPPVGSVPFSELTHSTDLAAAAAAAEEKRPRRSRGERREKAQIRTKTFEFVRRCACERIAVWPFAQADYALC